jgi:hypothetical protein
MKSQELRASHPQIAQHEQHRQPRRVLVQPAVAHLGIAELLIDDAERMLDLSSDAGLELLAFSIS